MYTHNLIVNAIKGTFSNYTESVLFLLLWLICKGNRLEAYRFIDKYHKIFGIRWLLKCLKIYPNAYYNYRKHRKATYYAQKKKVQQQIKKIYHSHNGVDGYRNMTIYLECIGYSKFVASGF